MSQSFLTELPERPEALLKGVAYGFNSGDPVVQTACSSMEAPSAVLSAQILLPKLQISFNETPQPDPRVPFEPVRFQMWFYDNHTASRGLPKPPNSLLDAIGHAVTRRFKLDEWASDAEVTARTFRDLTPCEVLGAMLFPVECPEDTWPWDWLFRFQVYTALVLAQHNDRRGVHSSATDHLVDVVHGPVDWTTTAALVGLAFRARRDVNCLTEVVDLFAKLLKRPMTPIWYMCAYKPIFQLLQHVPGLDSKTEATIAARVVELEDEDA